jgi:hypothetical protein
LRSEVQAIKEHAGTILIESPGSDGVENLDECLLDVLPVIQRRDDEEGPWPFPAFGGQIPRLAMVIAIETTAQCRRLAMFSAGHDVNTLSVHGGYTPLDSCSQTLKLKELPQRKSGNPLKSLALATEL